MATEALIMSLGKIKRGQELHALLPLLQLLGGTGDDWALCVPEPVAAALCRAIIRLDLESRTIRLPAVAELEVFMKEGAGNFAAVAAMLYAYAPSCALVAMCKAMDAASAVSASATWSSVEPERLYGLGKLWTWLADRFGQVGSFSQAVEVLGNMSQVWSLLYTGDTEVEMEAVRELHVSCALGAAVLRFPCDIGLAGSMVGFLLEPDLPWESDEVRCAILEECVDTVRDTHMSWIFANFIEEVVQEGLSLTGGGPRNPVVLAACLTHVLELMEGRPKTVKKLSERLVGSLASILTGFPELSARFAAVRSAQT